jgi:hypothetical protein
MTTSAENSTVLPIITALKAHVSPIGTPDGVAGLTASTISSLASGKTLRGFLPDSVRGALRERATGHVMGEFGYEPIINGFELVRSIDEAELNEARIIVAAALRPCPAATIQRELGRLHLATRNPTRPADEAKMQIALYAETLIEAEYPEDIVITVCRDWWQKRGIKYWPDWGDLGIPADRLVKERRDLAEALASGPKPPPEPHPEDIERRRLVAERDRQWAEAAAFRNAHPEMTTARAPERERLGEDKPRPVLPPYRLPDVDAPEVQRWLAEMGESVPAPVAGDFP